MGRIFCFIGDWKNNHRGIMEKFEGMHLSIECSLEKFYYFYIVHQEVT